MPVKMAKPIHKQNVILSSEEIWHVSSRIQLVSSVRKILGHNQERIATRLDQQLRLFLQFLFVRRPDIVAALIDGHTVCQPAQLDIDSSTSNNFKHLMLYTVKGKSRYAVVPHFHCPMQLQAESGNTGVRVRVSVWNEVGGPFIVNQGQSSSELSCYNYQTQLITPYLLTTIVNKCLVRFIWQVVVSVSLYRVLSKSRI